MKIRANYANSPSWKELTVKSSLKQFDSYFGIDGNKQVEDFMKEQFKKGNWFKGDIKWQRRLEGFISEYLWDLVRRKKFPNAYHSKIRMVGEQDINIKSL